VRIDPHPVDSGFYLFTDCFLQADVWLVLFYAIENLRDSDM